MKNLAFSTLSAVAVLAALSTNALAVDTGTINFNGEVIGQTCEVLPADGTYNVTLPAVSAAALSGAGATTETTAFNIALTNCSSVVGGVYAFFEQGTNVLDGKLVNNGTAENIVVELLDSNGSVINAGSTDQAENAATVVVSEGNASLNYSARYLATGTVTAGTISTSVTYSIAYL